MERREFLEDLLFGSVLRSEELDRDIGRVVVEEVFGFELRVEVIARVDALLHQALDIVAGEDCVLTYEVRDDVAVFVERRKPKREELLLSATVRLRLTESSSDREHFGPFRQEQVTLGAQR